jgi:bifunctional polynucleotide phosphatase/kinase
MEISWDNTDEYVVGLSYVIDIKKYQLSSLKIAAFDLDDTLIDKKQDPWKLIDRRMLPTLRALNDAHYLIMIFSNQSGMTVSPNFDFDSWLSHAEDFIMNLSQSLGKNFFIGLFVAKSVDIYRKPNLGLWNLMKSYLVHDIFDSKISVDLSKSFFCGDAGGRILAGTIKKSIYKSTKTGDFSDTDRKFAMNAGIKYFTPEETFYKEEPAEYKLVGLDPIKFLNEYRPTAPINVVFKPKQMIIMVGMPAVGKSYFVTNYLAPIGYAIVNQDSCKSQAKCLILTQEFLSKNSSIVIDNTNPDRSSRKKYIDLARKYKYDVRCIWFQTPAIVAKHLNNVRHLYDRTAKINSIVYHMYAKKFEMPHMDEGFSDIVSIDLILDPKLLNNEKWLKKFRIYSEA